MSMTIDQKEQVKTHNNSLISQKGYRTNSWLPLLNDPALRTLDEIKGRMAIMTALINISFKAPVAVVSRWIEQNSLLTHLSEWEKEILTKTTERLSINEVNALRWYLESLWALLWVTRMVSDLETEKYVGDNLASLVPNLQLGENTEKIARQTSLQKEDAIYVKLDYYYRIHWYCVDERLQGNRSKLNEGLVYARRKALEWVLDRNSNWDTIEMGT